VCCAGLNGLSVVPLYMQLCRLHYCPSQKYCLPPHTHTHTHTQLLSLPDQTNRTVAIYTDSKVTLDSQKNHTIHSVLIEEIRNMVRNLTKQNWSIHFGWVKAHTGIEGNEVADKLAKKAAQDGEDRNFVYDRIPISTVASSAKEEGLRKWQAQWERAVKGAKCRSLFPTVEQRLKIRFPIISEFTAIVSGHGKTKAYLNRFNLTNNPMCPCNDGEQSVEHLIHVCRILEPQRSSMIQHITTRGGIWPPANNKLVARHLNAFSQFLKSVDFSKLQSTKQGITCIYCTNIVCGQQTDNHL